MEEPLMYNPEEMTATPPGVDVKPKKEDDSNYGAKDWEKIVR